MSASEKRQRWIWRCDWGQDIPAWAIEAYGLGQWFVFTPASADDYFRARRK